MKYPYIVNKDGVWYPAGSEVPAGDNRENDSELQLTKTIISRMSVSDLRNLSSEKGLSDSDKMTGAEIKKWLINKLNL